MNALDSTRAALEAVLAAPDARATARAELDRMDAEVSSESDLLEVDEAAEICRRSKSTVRRWAAHHGLGRRWGGTWILSRRRLQAFLEGGLQ